MQGLLEPDGGEIDEVDVWAALHNGKLSQCHALLDLVAQLDDRRKVGIIIVIRIQGPPCILHIRY